MSTDETLPSLREEIVSTTREIFHLVGKRMSLAKQIAERKARLGTPIINREVERRLQEQVVETCNEVSLESEFGLKLLNSLITESIRIQNRSRILDSLPTVTEIFSRARSLERSGREVFHLEVGQPDFGPPERVRIMLNKALSEGHAGYTEPVGIPPLREKIASIFSQEYKRQILPDDVIVTVGGKLAIYLGISSVVGPGDEVVIIEPSYPAYSQFVQELGARPVFLSTTLDSSWSPAMSEVEAAINPTTKAIIMNTPSNPTGKMLEENTFKGITELASENDICIISDEVYCKFTQTNHSSILEFPESNHICVQSFSKSHGMTGFRLGFAVSNSEIIKKMAKLQSLLLTCAPEFIQYAGIAALDCDEDVEKNAKTIQSRRQLMIKLLEDFPLSFYPPDGGFYVFPKLNDENMNGRDFAERLLQETGVCVVPGAIYGRPYDSFFRIALCQTEDILAEAANRMGDILK